MEFWKETAVLVTLTMTGAMGASTAADFYVATNGNDAWSGKLPAPNRQRTDGPFATLERARDEIRKVKETGASPPGSPAFKLGFQPIPVEKIGPCKDPLRVSCPIVEAEGAREKPLQPRE